MQQFQDILIIGMGLIGGSLALALKKAGYRGRIRGYDLSKDSLLEAEVMGAIDTGYESLQEAVKDTDLIIMAVPVGHYVDIFREIAAYLSENVVITDVGSVKGYVEEVATKYLPQNIQFLGGHPMAGSEKGGIRAATPFLFQNAYYFLTPNKDTNRETIEGVEELIKMLGAFPVIVEAYEHDRIVAQISHMPHLVAVLLSNLLEKRNNIQCMPFVGGGFRDTTRIASGNPRMWRDIFFFNKKEILAGIDTLEEMLQEFKYKLLENQEEGVLKTLQRAKEIRDSIPLVGRDYIPPIFDLIINVEDRPGVLGELTQILGLNRINIKEIEILHAREGETGAVRVGFASREEQEKALTILRNREFPLVYRKGEKEDVYKPQS